MAKERICHRHATTQNALRLLYALPKGRYFANSIPKPPPLLPRPLN